MADSDATTEQRQAKFRRAVLEHHDPPTAYQEGKLLADRGRELFVGDYLIVDRIGAGAMGVVYKAINRRNRQWRALKMITRKAARTPERRMLMRREGAVAIKIRHPNVVRTYAVQVERLPYHIAMELLEGQALEAVLQQRKYLPPVEALSITRLVAHALKAVLDAGCVHGDVKPANIFVSDGGRVKLTDFGLAHRLGQNEELRRQGYVLGTGLYLAPEVAGLDRSNDIRSDLYSLGAVLYRMLTGVEPFPAVTRQVALRRHVDDELPNIEAVNRQMPVPVVDIVRKLMAKDPAARYQTPGDVIQAISAIDLH